MSVVGPRPALPNKVATYNDYQRQRLLVKPGMTCYWQTRRNRDSITFGENVLFRQWAIRWFVTAFVFAFGRERQCPLTVAYRSMPTSRQTLMTCLMFPPATPRSSSPMKRGEHLHAALALLA